MTPRYFYRDPLAAAWMAKHFGMQFENDNPGMGTGWAENKVLYYGVDRYYIHPESYHILEPQIGDFVSYHDSNLCGRIIAHDGPPHSDAFISITAVTLWLKDQYTIIQRKGIPFMWPEQEEKK